MSHRIFFRRQETQAKGSRRRVGFRPDADFAVHNEGFDDISLELMTKETGGNEKNQSIARVSRNEELNVFVDLVLKWLGSWR